MSLIDHVYTSENMIQGSAETSILMFCLLLKWLYVERYLTLVAIIQLKDQYVLWLIESVFGHICYTVMEIESLYKLHISPVWD